MQKTKPARLLLLSILSIYAMAIMVALSSCNDQPNTDEKIKTIPIDKHASVDVKIHQENIGENTVISFDKTFYNDSGAIVKQLITYDTVPLLKTVSDTLNTGMTFLNANGDQEERDTVVTHPKPYQFFVTIK